MPIAYSADLRLGCSQVDTKEYWARLYFTLRRRDDI